MEKLNVIMILMVASMFSTNIIAQQATLSNPTGAILPRVECEVDLRKEYIKIIGNNEKSFTLVKKDGKFSNYKFIVKKTDGKAKATFRVFINGIEDKGKDWTFEGSIPNGENTITLNNVLGKEVVLKVKNHSATNKISAICTPYVTSNSLVPYYKSDESFVGKITSTYEKYFNSPCNTKGTVEITRLGGTSSAEIVIEKGGTVIETRVIAANENVKRIILNNLGNDSSQLKLTIRNIETNKFIRTRIGLWSN
jgi:hypothetical protein